MKMPMWKNGRARHWGTALGALFCGAVAPLQAGDLAYGFGYAATHSDNIRNVPSNEQDELIHSYLAGFTYVERTTDVIARVRAQAEYRDYRDDIFGDESVFDLKSYLLWTISPQRFTWTLEDTYQQVQISSTAADTPGNRANVNVLNTGPDFYLRFNPVHTLALGARAGNVYTGSANADNDRFSGNVRWLYQATSVSTYSLNLQAQDVQYDDSTVNTDFMRQDVFLRADYRPSRSQYVIDLGVSQVNLERGRDLDGTLARLSWFRQLTPESTLGLSAGSEFSDTGTDILAASTAAATGTELPITAVPLSSSVLTSDVYYAKRGETFYNRRGSRLGLNLSANVQDLDFETTAQDRRESRGRLRTDFFYSGTTSVSLFTGHVRTEYQNFVREDTDRDSGIRFDYFLTRTLRLGLEGRRVDRSSTDPTAEFVENRVLLSLLYSSGPLFVPVSTR